MKTRLLLVPFLLVTATALAAGCGGGSGSVSADAVAQVGPTKITKTMFADVMQVGLANYLAHGQKPPAVGTPLYTQLKAQAVSFLVQREEFTQAGQKLDVTVTQKDIDAKLAATRTTYFQGSEKKLLSELKKDHVTLAQYEQYQIAFSLLGQKLYDKVTSSVTVSKADAQKYYDQNKTTYQCQAECRWVRHILVDKRSLADKLETKLKNNANFAALAQQYSKDTSSAKQGGRLTAIKGQLVKPFQTAAFSLKTGQISQPVHSQYGWHIIQALSPVEPAHTTQPFAWVYAQIKQNLSQTQQGTVWANWLAKLKKDYESKVSYQTGYAPATTTVPTTPTTTG